MIVWTDQASRQLDQIYEYIALSNSEDVAARIATQLIASVEQLEVFPMLGKTGRIAGTRELVIPGIPFVVAYALAEDQVVILAAYHSARQWPEQL